MSSVHVNMDLCYSDTLADFTGCFANYHMNRYLSRGLDPDEYLKVFSLTDPEEARKFMDRRHNYSNSQRALSLYRDFCKEAFFTEVQIRDFFAECLRWVHWCVSNYTADQVGAPFSSPIIREVLHDLAHIVYQNEGEEKIKGVMREAHDILLTEFGTGRAYLALEGIFLKLMADWDVTTQYVGDDHGQRMRRIFCAQSVGDQKSANAALARGFAAFHRALKDDDKFPRDQPGTHFPRINSYIWLLTNPLGLPSLEQEVIAASHIIKVQSKADLFDRFKVSTPDVAFEANGPIRTQRIAILVALAAGKNFSGQSQSNPGIVLIQCARPADISVFQGRIIGDWVNMMVRRDYATDLDLIGRTFREGQDRPGIYIDKLSLDGLLRDEHTIIQTQSLEEGGAALAAEGEVTDDEYRKAIVGLSTTTRVRKTKRKFSQIDTGEKGSVKKALVDDIAPDVDPKAEADNSTLFYGVLGIGTFLGVMFLSNRA